MSEREIHPQIEAELEEHGVHGHLHSQIHTQVHEHIHEHIHEQIRQGENIDKIEQHKVLTIRSHSGLSGDMLLAGLAVLLLELDGISPKCDEAQVWLDALVGDVMPDLAGSVLLKQHMVNGIAGFGVDIALPEAHEHRNLRDVLEIIEKSRISKAAKEKAATCFRILAECEGQVHGKSADEVHFHEIGALDSILDICSVCELFARLGPHSTICSPLPLADGSVACAHGIMPAPAPAVLKLLKGIPVKAFCGDLETGELVTPTAIALLRANNVGFGRWPHFRPEAIATIYGKKVFANAPNGVVFAFGYRVH